MHKNGAGTEIFSILTKALRQGTALSADLMQIRAKKTYLKAVRTMRDVAFRIFALGILWGITMSFVGLIHVFLLSLRIGWAVAILAALDLIAMLGLAIYTFSEKKWIQSSD